MKDKIWDTYTEQELKRETLMPYSTPPAFAYMAKCAWLFAHLPRPPLHILDVGMGSGWLSSFLAIHGYQVSAIDPSRIACEMAYKTIKMYGVRFDIQCRELVCRPQLRCDAIIYNATLHHIEEWELELEAAYRVLKPRGLIYLIEPGWKHEKNSKEFVEKHPGAIEQSMPPFKTLPVLKNCGFREIKVFPNYGFIHKLTVKGVPGIIASILAHLYKFHDGLIIGRK